MTLRNGYLTKYQRLLFWQSLTFHLQLWPKCACVADVKKGLSVIIDKLPRFWMHEHATGATEETQVGLDPDQKAALQELRYVTSLQTHQDPALYVAAQQACITGCACSAAW